MMAPNPPPDFNRHPYKHPAVWKHHLVKTASGRPDGVAITTASCECGWIICTKASFEGHLAQTTRDRRALARRHRGSRNRAFN